MVVAYTERFDINNVWKAPHTKNKVFHASFSSCISRFFRLFVSLFSALWIALGRCLIAVGNARLAESFLQLSMKVFPHPDTILLLGEMAIDDLKKLNCIEIWRIPEVWRKKKFLELEF